MNIRNNFQENNILELKAEDYRRFLDEKVLKGKKLWPYNSLRIRSSHRPVQVNRLEWPVLVHSSEWLEAFLQNPPQATLQTFLQNSTLAYYLPEKQLLRLAGHNQLEQYLHESASATATLPLINVENKQSLKKHLSSKPILHALWQAANEAEFQGMLTCCECGAACCASEHVWVKNGACLFYISIVAAGISEIRLLPFGIKQAAAEVG